jgi:hypothetical protein
VDLDLLIELQARTDPFVVWATSDIHQGLPGHPANDTTPGFRDEWKWIVEPKLILGDATATIQFPDLPPELIIVPDVAGNHDRCLGAPRSLRIGDTEFLHGDLFDPWVHKVVGRPVTWAVGKLEKKWPNADCVLDSWALKLFVRGGRYGRAQHYLKAAAAYGKARGAKQVVFGHLHELIHNVTVDGIRITCTGCYCNDRRDIVPIVVNAVISKQRGSHGSTDGEVL